MEYIRFSENYYNNSLIPSTDDPLSYIKNKNKPHFISMMKYNEDHYKEWQKTHSVSSFSGGKTNKIWADFDSEDLKKSFQDANVFVHRLLDIGMKEENIEISFSGNKGVGIIVNINEDVSHEQSSNIAISLGKDLSTFDTTMYDHQRIFRLLFTKNEKTGLYKTPITLEELENADIQYTKDNAKDISHFDIPTVKSFYKVFNVNDGLRKLFKKEEKTKVKEPIISTEIDFTNRPKGWKKYKWALLQGHFEAGERHNALVVLAATARGLGFDKETTYYLCKSALKKQAALKGSDEFPKEELWDNIIEQSIFSDNWEGGQYSPQNNAWLASYCERMGFEVDEKEESSIITVDDMSKVFTDYAQNFDKNIIKTGVSLIDENVMFLAGTHNGVLGQPGAGKTSWAIDFLENSSKNDIESIFFSLDMSLPVVFAKLIQRELSCSFKDAMRIFKDNPSQANRLVEQFKEKYKNVSFNFKTGLNVSDMRNIIKNKEEKTGRKVKLVITDYLERIAGPSSDALANTGFISNQFNDLANEEQICSVLLLQTQKHSTVDISDPLLSMKQIKGSSIIEQSCSVILTLWREGYNPKTIEDDRYISFAAVKNRFGNLWSDDFYWNGVRGSVSELTEEQRDELAAFRKKKIEMRMEGMQKSNEGWQ